MKFAILLGRGIEGCGVTRCAIELAKELDAPIFASLDKKWPRRELTSYDGIIEYKFSDAVNIDRLVNNINQMYDCVLIFSVPPVKGFSDIAVDNFFTLVKRIQCVKIALQFDHNIQSIRRNANFVDILSNCDAIMTHSLTNPFADFVRKEDIQVPLYKMSLGFNFTEHKAVFWKPVEYQRKIVRWIGRFAGWKNPMTMIRFHDFLLRKAEFITILEGLEANISYEELLKGPEVVNKFRPRSEYGETSNFEHDQEERFTGAYLYPPYVHDDCMHRLSNSMFGSDLYQLKPEMYGNNIENCHAEVVACGAIPIFHRHFGSNIVHARTGNPPIYDQDESGTLWLDDDCDNQLLVFNEMVKLANDKFYRDEQRHKAFEYWRDHADVVYSAGEIRQVYNEVK